MTAKEFWKQKFDEYPQNDSEKLAVTMMQEYRQHEQPSSEDKETNELSRKFLSMEGQLLEKDFEIEKLKGIISMMETQNFMSS